MLMLDRRIGVSESILFIDKETGDVMARIVVKQLKGENTATIGIRALQSILVLRDEHCPELNDKLTIMRKGTQT